MSDFGLSAAVK